MSNYLLKNESSQYFDCGYSCDNAIFLSINGDNFFITDGRYTTEAEYLIKNASVITAKNLTETAKDLIKKAKIKDLILDPKEWNILDYDLFSKDLKKLKIKNESDFGAKKRVIKSNEELELIKQSSLLNKNAFKNVAKHLKKFGLNKTEKELQFQAKNIFLDNGNLDISFETILAFDENSAKPHAKPTDKILKQNSLILLDAGIKYKRYCSDRTRTIFFNDDIEFNKKQSFSDLKIQKIYDIVKKAQEKAIKKAKIGMKAKKLDQIARDVIDKSGYGEFFVHSLGHGVGLDIHEHPYINKNNNEILKENMVFTIEPGIYLPNEFGIRIEDMIVLKNDGAEVL